MARKMIVEVVADVVQYLKGIEASAQATSTLNVQVNELNVDVAKLAATQVKASVQSTERLRMQVAAYQQLAAAAVEGSQEQIAATNLATAAERRLAVATSIAGAESRAAAVGAHGLTRNVEAAGRGALTGSRLFHSFGRSLVFASGGFVAFEGVAELIRGTIEISRHATVAQRQLAAQMAASGESFAAHREEIEHVAHSYARLGFDNAEVISSLAVLERGTGSITKALKLETLAAEVARVKGIDLAAGALTVAKVFGGQETALRRAVPGLPKMAHGMDLIAAAQKKLAGQAEAATTPANRFVAALANTEEITGKVLLPTLNKYLTKMSDWLSQTENQQKVAKTLAQVLAGLSAVFGAVGAAMGALNSITGSTKTSLELLLGAFVAFKTAKVIATLGSIATSVGNIGTKAVVAEGEVATLGTRLSGLTLAPYVITILVAYDDYKHPEHILDRAKKVGDFLANLKDPVADALKSLPTVGPALSSLAPLLRGLKGPPGEPKVKPGAGPLRRGGGPDLGHELPEEAPARRTGLLGKPAPFEDQLSRALSRLEVRPLRGQLARLGQLEAILRDRISHARTIQGKLKLEDHLWDVIAKEKDVREQLAQQVIDALQFKVDKAAVTAGLNDDIAALEALEAGIEKRIKIEGRTLDLQRQEFDVQQQIAAKRKERLENRQFRALGLGPGGEELVPQAGALQKQLAQVRAAVSGTSLDTPKLRAQLAKIANVLLTWGKNTSKAVRQTIKQTLDGLQDDLKSSTGELTKWSHTSSTAIIRGLGLDPRQQELLRGRIAGLGKGMGVPGRSSMAFAGAGGSGVTIHGDVHVTANNPREFENAVTKRRKARPGNRRGAR